jgi:hypothetical protein
VTIITRTRVQSSVEYGMILAHPSKRSRIIMSDDSEDDEKDKMDVDEVNFFLKLDINFLDARKKRVAQEKIRKETQSGEKPTSCCIRV